MKPVRRPQYLAEPQHFEGYFEASWAGLAVLECEMADVRCWSGHSSGGHQPIFKGGEILTLFGKCLHFLITYQPPPHVATIHMQKVSQAYNVVEIDSFGVGRGWIQSGHGFPGKEKTFKKKNHLFP